MLIVEFKRHLPTKKLRKSHSGKEKQSGSPKMSNQTQISYNPMSDNKL